MLNRSSPPGRDCRKMRHVAFLRTGLRRQANTAGALRGYPVKCAFSILDTIFRLFYACFSSNPFISARLCYPYLSPIHWLCWITFLLFPAVNWLYSKWLHFLSSFLRNISHSFFQWTYFLSSFFKSDCIFWVHFSKMIAFFKFTVTVSLPIIQPPFLWQPWRFPCTANPFLHSPS